MALAPNDTVPLDRRFERATTSDTAEYWAEALADKPRDWEWLRERSRVVALLAQAGSGKTVEFMRQVDEVRSANRDAFFFRVERLCSGAVQGAHETPDCRARFEKWVKVDRPAEFFLDAVDEAKLPQARTARPLRDALRELSFALGPHLGRISIFVSCRSSEWFDDVEQKALEEFAAAMSAARIDPEPISVFNATFAPLDGARVSLLAKDRGGDDAIAVLTESEAVADIVTPLDAILYLDTYRIVPGATARRGELAAVRPSPELTRYMASRRYVEAGALLVKPVAAVTGQQVCRLGATVTIDGATVAMARDVDRAQRPLPVWTGCRRLRSDAVFLLAPAVPASFDGRYFGPVATSSIVGRAVPLWTWP